MILYKQTLEVDHRVWEGGAENESQGFTKRKT
jgi:hypothetical protein